MFNSCTTKCLCWNDTQSTRLLALAGLSFTACSKQHIEWHQKLSSMCKTKPGTECITGACDVMPLPFRQQSMLFMNDPHAIKEFGQVLSPQSNSWQPGVHKALPFGGTSGILILSRWLWRHTSYLSLRHRGISSNLSRS